MGRLAPPVFPAARVAGDAPHVVRRERAGGCSWGVVPAEAEGALVMKFFLKIDGVEFWALISVALIVVVLEHV